MMLVPVSCATPLGGIKLSAWFPWWLLGQPLVPLGVFVVAVVAVNQGTELFASGPWPSNSSMWRFISASAGSRSGVGNWVYAIALWP